MASLASERNWLLNPATIKKVQQCRRLIQMEFGVKLHLTEHDLVGQLETFAARSRSDTLARTWADLKEAVPELADAVAEAFPQNTKRTYRGQPIADSEPATKGIDDEPPQPRKTKVIYRGQVVG